MCRLMAWLCLLCGTLSASAATAIELTEHFLPSACRTHGQPTLIIVDVTRRGEIDDSISLLMYSELERRGCIEVIGVVSIFGNGRSSTAQVHENLQRRLEELGLERWKPRLLRGPDRKSFGETTPLDGERLARIAEVINARRNVAIAELGPVTVSACLLMNNLVPPDRVERILGIGGRLEGERFGTGRTLLGSLFGFRDMNVAEDTKAVQHLLRHHPEKLWMVTYRAGIGDRSITPEMVADYAPALAEQAESRARMMRKMLGYRGIASWDTWTTSYFLEGGAERLGCKAVLAAMRYADQSYRDPMQLLLDIPGGHPITACH